MTVRRFRSVEEMTPPRDAGSTPLECLRAAVELSSLCIALSRRRPEPGVRRFRSIEEANEARRRLEEGG